jgi:hypothetical protein
MQTSNFNILLTCAENPLGLWILPTAQHLRLVVEFLRSLVGPRRNLVPPLHGMLVGSRIPDTMVVKTEHPGAQGIRSEGSVQAVQDRGYNHQYNHLCKCTTTEILRYCDLQSCHRVVLQEVTCILAHGRCIFLLNFWKPPTKLHVVITQKTTTLILTVVNS